MDTDLRRLPGLDNLKGFAAAARHLSFTRAATELFLTQSAISRQIQTLEEQLGVRLFVRRTRRLELTAEGEVLRRAADEALGRLAEVCAGLRAAARQERVTLSTSVGVASLWLLPRLAAFQDRHPEVEVRISTNNRMVDLAREDVDLAMRFCRPEAAPAGIRLFGDEVFPVASPAVAKALPARWTPASLGRTTLVAFEDGSAFSWLAWDRWLAELGLAGARPRAVLRFNHYDQSVRAAVDGRGVALGRLALVRDLIAEGRLVPVTGRRETVQDRAYYLVAGPGRQRPEVAAFAAWLCSEAAAGAVSPDAAPSATAGPGRVRRP
ncbi:MAG TPA: LysR substrate-binding domain-containing protein [Rhodocyclaceae bacterium]|nr:LysR substrate-binding domain-containing protein [Rhodocyclaceae bacterium]HNH36424.1 LysR substrate-binding domain-containing protein [Rhodocyclaceae bacterium]